MLEARMLEANAAAASAIEAMERVPAIDSSTCQSTSVAADRKRLRSALPKDCYWRNQAETRGARGVGYFCKPNRSQPLVRQKSCLQKQQTGGVMGMLIILTAVSALVALTAALAALVTPSIAGTIKSLAAAVPRTVPGQIAGISPEEIQPFTAVNGPPASCRSLLRNQPSMRRWCVEI